MWTEVTILATGLAACSLAMALLWYRQQQTGNAGIVDVGWTFGVGALGVLAAIVSEGWPWRRLAIGTIFALWSLRLGSYLLRDRILGKPEDRRYAALRESWGPRADVRFFWFFQAQAAAAAFFALPAAIVAANPARTFGAIEALALPLWATAFAGEHLADRQLERFKQDPRNKGRTCQIGLWRYSRHPNYFFEWLMWVAVALFALGSPWGAVALLCPAVMLVLLFRFTGIPATEAQALRTRGAEYRQYQQSTSVFIPWFQRS